MIAPTTSFTASPGPFASPPPTGEATPLLALRELRVTYRGQREPVPVLQGLDLDIRHGEALGLVGESGSGKSTLALAIQGLLPTGRSDVGGSAVLAGHGDLFTLPEARRRRLRGDRIAMIFQNPMTSLNPYLRIGDQLVEPLMLHRGLSRAEATARLVDILTSVGLPDPASRLRHYPHEFSGGMRQRAMIAMALSCDPDLLIADEPTTALDVTTQRKVLDILRAGQRARRMALLLVSHDLGVIAETCDTVAVMYAGRIVEYGPVAEVLQRPRHPYTQALQRAIPSHRTTRRLEPLPGAPPTLRDRLPGCVLANRCPHVQAACHVEPTPFRVAPGNGLHWHRCRLDITVEQAAAVEGGSAAAPSTADPGPHVSPAIAPSTPTAPTAQPPVLDVHDLVVRYPGRAGFFRSGPTFTAVHGASFSVRPGEVLGIAGESGSGKSSLIRAVLHLVIPAAGTVALDGAPVTPRNLRQVWQRMQLIFQDPASSLDPRMTIADIIAEPLRRYGLAGQRAELDGRIRELMDHVGLRAAWRDRFPHEFSGGQQQRIGIARALALRPRILFCDEPVSALDVSIQAQILNLLKQLQREQGMAMVFVSHDLSVIRYLCDRVLIMQDGRIVEHGPTADVFTAPQSDYTRTLLAAIPGR